MKVVFRWRDVTWWAAVCLALGACASPALEAEPWQTLLDGTSLTDWESIPYGGEGEVRVAEDGILLPYGVFLTGIRRPAGLPVQTNYELELRATRLMGNDFFCGLTLPVEEEFATVILGGWGGTLCGLSCIDGEDASSNDTCSYQSFQRGREYTLLVRVEPGRVRAWLDGVPLFDADVQGKQVALRTEMLPSPPLSISCFTTTASVASLRWRSLPVR